MGYYMTQRETIFFIDRFNLVNVEKAIRDLEPGSWVTESREKDYLEQLFQNWRWSVEFDTAGNINNIMFEGEKLGDEKKFFNAIAPFVRKGSYIEMTGEDGSLWRWEFDGSMCIENVPNISWD